MKTCWRSFRGIASLGVLATVLLATAILAPGAQAYSPEFQMLAPSSVPLTGVATNPATGLVYAQENEGTNFFVYDPRTNAWSELAPAPTNSGNNGGATYLDGKIYVSYTGHSEIDVYDIALNAWTVIPNPLGSGTGDITAGNGLIYLAVGHEMAAYDPATETTTPLTGFGNFAQSTHAGAGFEPWGGLQFDGARIFGHQGNGGTGFGSYDVAGDSWTELSPVPRVEIETGPGETEEVGGAVLGSALNPATDSYITYGSYGEYELYRYDIGTGSWSETEIPFESEEGIGDGGMAYVSIPGHEGVYIIQGEEGTEFVRYRERETADLATSMSASVTPTATGGEITYSIQVKNNGPETARQVILSDALPAGTTFGSVAASTGSCSGTSTVSCGIAALGSGATATVTLKVTAAPGTVSNTAAASSEAIDPNSGNDKATATVTVTAAVAPPLAQCKVPKLKGKKTKAAKKALKKANCKPGKVKHAFSGKVKKGRVVKAGKPGKSFANGTKINLVVSKGTKPKKGSHKS